MPKIRSPERKRRPEHGGNLPRSKIVLSPDSLALKCVDFPGYEHPRYRLFVDTFSNFQEIFFLERLPGDAAVQDHNLSVDLAEGMKATVVLVRQRCDAQITPIKGESERRLIIGTPSHHGRQPFHPGDGVFKCPNKSR